MCVPLHRATGDGRRATGEDIMAWSTDRPGHNVRVDQDAEFVEFTRADAAPGINSLEL
jgi:hypothetical protein